MEPDRVVATVSSVAQLTQDLTGLRLPNDEEFRSPELDEKDLPEKDPDEQRDRNQGPSPEDLLTVTAPIRGRGLPPIRNLLSQPEPSVVTDLGDQLQFFSLARTYSQPLSSNSSSGRLQSAIHEALVHSDVGQREFLPRRQLPKLVDKASVEAELRRCQASIIKRIQTRNFDPPASYKKLSTEAQKICGTGQQSWRAYPETEKEHIASRPAHQEKTYRKIFAILLLIERPSRIRDFVEEEVCDADLPLEAPNKATKPWDLRRKKVPNEPLHCFSRWRHNTVKRFEESQWTVYAPFLGQDERKLALFFKIPDRTVLPFTKWERIGPAGGYGQVYRTEIHPDHHAFHQVNESQTARRQVFAIKKLFHKSEPDFRREFDILRTVSKIGHPHIISLLAAYQHQGYYHFIFPWAAADLATYWQNNCPGNDADTARWLAEQCAGLAGGLSTIHRYVTLSGDSLLNAIVTEGILRVTPNNPPTKVQTRTDRPRVLFCRHGDIKCENILWFPDHNPGSVDGFGKGTLKITDFGTSEIMTHDETPWKKLPTSPMYRPPEAVKSLCDSLISTSYDIWGLGCVYLEFAAWCFGGWDQIEAFLRKRWMRDDTFHNFHTGRFFEAPHDENAACRARVKPGVYAFIDELRSDPACTHFFHDFLDMVCEGMLVVEQESGRRRATAAKIATKIDDMRKKGETDAKYFSEPMTLLEWTEIRNLELPGS